VRDAEKERRKAVEEYRRKVTELEQAREDALDARRAELWALLFPDPLAMSEPGIDAVAMIGGRVRREIPETRSRISSLTVLAMFRADADWMDEAANPEQKAKLKGVDPRHHPEAGWFSDPECVERQRKRTEETLAKKRDTKRDGRTDRENLR